MPSTEKRPRIRPAQAKMIDQIRGRVPFEAEVEEAIGTYLDLYFIERRGRKPKPATQAEVLINLLRSDTFQMHKGDFLAAVAEATEWLDERLDEFARDEELEGD